MNLSSNFLVNPPVGAILMLGASVFYVGLLQLQIPILWNNNFCISDTSDLVNGGVSDAISYSQL